MRRGRNPYRDYSPARKLAWALAPRTRGWLLTDTHYRRGRDAGYLPAIVLLKGGRLALIDSPWGPSEPPPPWGVARYAEETEIEEVEKQIVAGLGRHLAEQDLIWPGGS
jgi:hypothetical protein